MNDNSFDIIFRMELFCLLTLIREEGFDRENLLESLLPVFAFSSVRDRDSSRLRMQELLDEAAGRNLVKEALETGLTAIGEAFLMETAEELTEVAAGVAPRIETSLAPRVGSDQAAMFKRRFIALGDLLGELSAEPEGEAAPVISAALTVRAEQVLSETGSGVTRRIKDLIDYYYALASRLHCSIEGKNHPPEPDYGALEWRPVRDGVEFATVRGRFENGPLHANFLRIDPRRVTITTAAAADQHLQAAEPGDWSDLPVIAARHGALEATTGGFFLYSEENLPPPMKRGDPVGLMVSEGRVISPPLFPRGALLLGETGKTVIKIMGMETLDIGFSSGEGDTWFEVSAPFPEEPDASLDSGPVGDVSGEGTGPDRCGRYLLRPLRGRAGESSAGAVPASAGEDSTEYSHPELFTPVFGPGAAEPGEGATCIAVVNRIVHGKQAGGPLEVPLNGFVLVFPADHPVSASLEPGDEVLFRLKPDSDVGSVRVAMAGGPVLPCDGTNPSMEAEFFTGDFPPVTFSSDSTIGTNPLPRLAWGIDGRNRLVAAAVDGRNLALSIGKSIMEMDRLMRSLDCVRALNMDGGSSKRMCVEGSVVDLSSTEILPAAEPDGPPPRRPVLTAFFILPRRCVEEDDA